MTETPIPASRIRRFRAPVKPPATELSASSSSGALIHAAATSFKGLGPWETGDTGDMFELIVAIPHAPADERQVPEWVIFLTDIEITGNNEVKTRSRSYTIKGTLVVAPTGEVGEVGDPDANISSLKYDLYTDTDDHIFDDTRFEEYLPLGRLPKEELATVEYIFRNIPKGPNNFFIARLLACLWERHLVSGIAVETVTYRACYSDDEHDFFGAYLDWDQVHLWRWGDDDERLMVFRRLGPAVPAWGPR
ncbi:hypothetical protein BDW67DRAFT_189559 [Aspergillus spinulosporus]